MDLSYYEKLVDGLIDVAIGRPAAQSSLSQWSRTGEASNAVSGQLCVDFAFHTDFEDRPWWSVDLGRILPIENIIVHNRIGSFQSRAARLRVEIANDFHQWDLVHAGYCMFGGGTNGYPFVARIGSALHARYVRLSLDDMQYMHLSKVEIYVRSEFVVLIDYLERFDIPYQQISRIIGSYKLTKSDTSQTNAIVGIRIDYSGRFGNLLIQYINVIQLAERTGLKYIMLGRHELLDLKMEFTLNGIRISPPDQPLPPDGMLLTGEFFNSDDFVPVLSPFLRFLPQDEVDSSRVVHNYLVPYVLTGIPVDGEQHFEDELTIHIRSGDVFKSDDPVTYGYRQPPLSFYILVIERMQKAGRINKVRLVFEDRGNPCVDALSIWLADQLIPCRIQNASLREDMSALVNAPHLVFGHGTFGYGACRLSRKIKTVHFFAPQLGGSYECMPNIEEVYRVWDMEDKYIKAFEYGKPFGPEEGWRRTPAMMNTMITYPEEWLRIERLR